MAPMWLANITLLFLCSFSVLCSGIVSDVTSDVFTGSKNGVVAAFGDFNADKMTDIFVLSDSGKTLHLLQAEQELTKKTASFSRKIMIDGKISNGTFIAGVAPGDFNGDAQMDLLVLRKQDGQAADNSTVAAQIYWGNSVFKSFDYPLQFSEPLRDQPSVIDINGDMIPDLIGETVQGERLTYIFSQSGNYTKKKLVNGTSDAAFSPLRVPQSSAFFDFNGDLVADLCIVSEKDHQVQFEIWLNEGGTFKWTKTIEQPKDLKKCGRPSYYDLNDNHEINIVLPGCLDDECSQSAIFVWGRDAWSKLEVNFESGKENWQLVSGVPSVSWLQLPFMLRFGDYNLDGFPDAVAILKAASNETYAAFLLENTPCSACANFSRTFTLNRLTLPSSRPLLAAFYDFMENGILDILLTVYHEGAPELLALEQDFTADAYFLKVMVVSGLCSSNCPHGHQPYGVSQVGPVVRFQTTTSTGSKEIGVSSQLSQSAYYSLQLPFEVFGLGQTPNFVDYLEVGIQNPPNSGRRQRSWPSIIPNSQVVVIPYPTDSPSKWRTKLYVTPSRLVLLTGVSLLGTCALIAIVIGLLHWRERVEDKKEKLQEAQRFHFDAM